MASMNAHLIASYREYGIRIGNAFRQHDESERQRLITEYYQVPPNMPYPQPYYGQQQVPLRPLEVRSIYHSSNSPPVDMSELQDSRGRPLTTWSFVDNLVQEQEREKSPAAISTPNHGSITSGGRTLHSSPYTPAQRIVTDPTHSSQRGQVPFHNPSAEQTGSPRRGGKFDLRQFECGRTNNNNNNNRNIDENLRSHQEPIDTISNANLKDPALEPNQPDFIMKRKRSQTPTPRSTSESSDTMLMSRRTPPARFATLHNKQTAPMPAHLSTVTDRTNATAQSQYVQPIFNDALMLGNAPMIPTRDGNYAATGQPRTVHSQPVTSMMGQIDFYPTSTRQSFATSRSPLPRILERTAPAASATAAATVLSPTAPVYQPPTARLTAHANSGVPTYSQQPHFTIEQLVTRVDRLQVKLEENTQLTMQFVGRQAQDRREMAELRKEVKEMHTRLDAIEGAGRTPGARVVSEQEREIGDGWYNQL